MKGYEDIKHNVIGLRKKDSAVRPISLVYGEDALSPRRKILLKNS